MTETIACPECEASLTLTPVAPGQTVQCPRCQRVFAPKSSTKRESTAAEPSVPTAPVEPYEDFDVGSSLPFFRQLTAPKGVWFSYVTMALLAATSMGFFFLGWGYAESHLMRLDVINRIHDHNHGQFLVQMAQEWLFWTIWPTFVALMIWLPIAARNAGMLRVQGLASPGTVALFFFIPLANVIVTYLHLQEIWRASDPLRTDDPYLWKTSPRSALIRVWGLHLIAIPSLAILMYKLEMAGPAFWPLLDLLFLAAICGCASACVFLIFIMHSVIVRQRERYSRLYEDPA